MAIEEDERAIAGHHLRNLLIQQWEERQKKELEEDYTEHDAQGASDAKQLLNHHSTIATVRKDNVFTSELTEEEQEIVRQRVELQRKQFEQFMKRQNEKRTRKIRSIHPYITEREALQALKECNDDENEVVEKLMQAGFFHEVRKAIATEGRTDDSSDDEKGNDSDNNGDIPADKQFISRKRKNVDKKRLKRLRLDEALKNVDEGNFEGWSEARIRAWQLKDKNPNAYYYRFNDPGVEQRNGTWNKEERALFFQRVEEIGVNGQWGIFSMVIPGRVGYQCSNFYRHLVETGQVVDPNYVIDEKGKAHYLFSKGICKHTKSHKRKDPDDAPQVKVKQQGKKRKGRTQKKKKGKEEDEDAHEEDDDEYVPPSSLKKQKGDDEEDEEARKNENPLPGFLDPITLEEVERPAIAPSGHVMDYKSWSRCLSSNGGLCPLTKQPLKKRDLVILTWKNIHEYNDRIVNWPDKK